MRTRKACTRHCSGTVEFEEPLREGRNQRVCGRDNAEKGVEGWVWGRMRSEEEMERRRDEKETRGQFRLIFHIAELPADFEMLSMLLRWPGSVEWKRHESLNRAYVCIDDSDGKSCCDSDSDLACMYQFHAFFRILEGLIKMHLKAKTSSKVTNELLPLRNRRNHELWQLEL
jgi:hypothetical protein